MAKGPADPGVDSSLPLAEAFRGNGDPDADREPPLGRRNQISGVAGIEMFHFCSLHAQGVEPLAPAALKTLCIMENQRC
jgi:hypothetical protein